MDNDEPDLESDPLVVEELSTVELSEASVAFSQSITSFNKTTYADRRQVGGRWAPAFPETSLERQEAYVERMIARDKELNIG